MTADSGTAPTPEAQEQESAMTPGSVGSAWIAAERLRQIAVEGWTPEHDAEHTSDDLALAAVCYATPPRKRDPRTLPRDWPWGGIFWKPTPDDRIRELVKAGALIAAEIDRLVSQQVSEVTADA